MGQCPQPELTIYLYQPKDTHTPTVPSLPSRASTPSTVPGSLLCRVKEWRPRVGGHLEALTLQVCIYVCLHVGVVHTQAMWQWVHGH